MKMVTFKAVSINPEAVATVVDNNYRPVVFGDEEMEENIKKSTITLLDGRQFDVEGDRNSVVRMLESPGMV